MKLPVPAGNAVMAVCLACTLGLAGLPASPLYADEPQDASASASSDAAISSSAPGAAATAQDNTAPAQEAPAPAAQEPAAAQDPAPAQNQQETPAADSGAAATEPSNNGKESGSPENKEAENAEDEKAAEEQKAKEEEEKAAEEQKAKEEEEKAKEKAEKEKKKNDKEAAAKAAEEEFEKAKAEAESAAAQLSELPALQAELAPCFEQLSGAWGRLQEIDAQRAPFAAQRQGYLDEQEALRIERDTIIYERETASERKAEAVYGLMLVDEELSRTGGVDLLSVILGTSNATEAESYGYLLEKVATCIAGRVAEAEQDRTGDTGRVDEVNERIAAISEDVAAVEAEMAASEDERNAVLGEVADVVERGNAIAFNIERICSEARQGAKDASAKVLALSGVDTTPNTTSANAEKAAREAAEAAAAMEAVAAAAEAATAIEAAAEAAAASSGAASSGADSLASSASSQASSVSSSASADAEAEDEEVLVPDNVTAFVEESKAWELKDDPLRVAAQQDAGAWYDAVDALVGAEGYISYGMGLDFALDEEAFVQKWAAAINEFYAQKGNPPLGGWGEDLARTAYAYHTDPRLCAAVSIIESGGGAICIRPHNAWGWGAADSDPYNLASEWSSWPSAIEAWHRGMTTNPYGLGSSPSVSQLSDIYCSTPIWAHRVVGFMEEMSAIARAQQAEFEQQTASVVAAAQKAWGPVSERTEADGEGTADAEGGSAEGGGEAADGGSESTDRLSA